MRDMSRTMMMLAAIGAFPAIAGAQTPTGESADRAARVEARMVSAVELADQVVRPESLAEEMVRLNVPGVSVAVIRNGQIAWVKGYGRADRGGAAITPDTLFQAASISKPVTAVAAMRLVQQGRLELDGDVNAQLTSWKLPTDAFGPVSLRQLLAHTAGTSVHGFDGYAAGARVPTLREVLDGKPPANSAAITVSAAPGTGWRYSGGGYEIVQQLMIDRGGAAFPVLMHDLVLAPAGMTNSLFAQPLPAALLTKAALPHDAAGKPVAGGPHTYPELAAAGLWTTPGDLARFAIAVQRSAAGRPGALLSKGRATEMLTPGLGQWGLGFELRGEGAARSFAHGGANAGYMNYFIADIDGGNGAVVMTNGDRGSELAQDLIRSISREYGWAGFKPIVRRAVPLMPAESDRMVGTYAIPGLGTFSIGRDAEGLTLSLREGSSERLYAASATEFFVLSQDARLLVAPGSGPIQGRVVSGAFDLAFTRAAAAK